MNRNTLILGVVAIGTALGLRAQWLNYPTTGVPRLPNGQPDFFAPTPKTSGGQPDLSGLWEADKTGGTGTSFAGAQLPPLFTDIGIGVKGGLRSPLGDGLHSMHGLPRTRRTALTQGVCRWASFGCTPTYLHGRSFSCRA
jgi:hypothetical protein